MKKAFNLLWSVLIGSLLISMSLVLFPIIGLIALFNKSFISKLILPAQGFKFNAQPIKQNNRFTVRTKDNFQLDTIEISQNEKIPDKLKHYLIYFCGNAMSYTEALETLKNLSASSSNITVIGFDYKGVNKSTGGTSSFTDLIDAGQAQVQRLLTQGVQSKHICLYGFSLGGAVATAVAKHFHKNNQPIYCFNDRSFSSVPYVVKSIIQGIPFSGGIIAWLWFPVIKGVLSLLGWGYNIAHAYHTIPNTYKAHIFVKEDEVIAYEASLDRALPYSSHDHQAPYSSNAMEVAREYRNACAFKHAASIDQLVNKEGVSGSCFFKQFINGMSSPIHILLQQETFSQN